MFAEGERGKIQKVYTRVCKDSGFRMDPIDAASFTAQVLDLPSGLTVMEALGFSSMEQVAAGEHPCCDLI